MRLALAAGLPLALAVGCEPSPCEELVEAWMQCYCDGAKPTTTRPQSSIDEACASPEAFVSSDGSPLPAPEREAIERCDEGDATWAGERIDRSECRAGGSYVCGGSAEETACLPPE